MLGSSIFSFSAGLYLLLTIGKGGVFATNLILWALPTILLGPFLGSLVDRYSKKRILVMSDILNGLLMFILFILWDRVDNREGLIYLATFFTSFLGFFVQVAFSASRPELFPKEWLIKANSITNTLDSMSNILGPLLGGFVYSLVEFKLIILINGVSFFISALFECFLQYFKKGITEREEVSFLNGIKNILESKHLLTVLFVGILLNIGQGIMLLVPLPYVIKNVFRYSDTTYGMVQGMLSIGLIVSSFIVTKRNKEVAIERLHRVFYGFSLVGLLFAIPLFISLDRMATLAFYFLGMFIFGFLLLFINVGVITVLQTKSKPNLMGQVIATFIGIVRIILPISLFFGGVITDISPKIGFISGTTVYLIGALCFTYFWHREKVLIFKSNGTYQGIIKK